MKLFQIKFLLALWVFTVAMPRSLQADPEPTPPTKPLVYEIPSSSTPNSHAPVLVDALERTSGNVYFIDGSSVFADIEAVEKQMSKLVAQAPPGSSFVLFDPVRKQVERSIAERIFRKDQALPAKARYFTHFGDLDRNVPRSVNAAGLFQEVLAKYAPSKTSGHKVISLLGGESKLDVTDTRGQVLPSRVEASGLQQTVFLSKDENPFVSSSSGSQSVVANSVVEGLNRNGKSKVEVLLFGGDRNVQGDRVLDLLGTLKKRLSKPMQVEGHLFGSDGTGELQADRIGAAVAGIQPLFSAKSAGQGDKARVSVSKESLPEGSSNLSHERSFEVEVPTWFGAGKQRLTIKLGLDTQKLYVEVEPKKFWNPLGSLKVKIGNGRPFELKPGVTHLVRDVDPGFAMSPYSVVQVTQKPSAFAPEVPIASFVLIPERHRADIQNQSVAPQESPINRIRRTMSELHPEAVKSDTRTVGSYEVKTVFLMDVIKAISELEKEAGIPNVERIEEELQHNKDYTIRAAFEPKTGRLVAYYAYDEFEENEKKANGLTAPGGRVVLRRFVVSPELEDSELTHHMVQDLKAQFADFRRAQEKDGLLGPHRLLVAPEHPTDLLGQALKAQGFVARDRLVQGPWAGEGDRWLFKADFDEYPGDVTAENPYDRLGISQDAPREKILAALRKSRRLFAGNPEVHESMMQAANQIMRMRKDKKIKEAAPAVEGNLEKHPAATSDLYSRLGVSMDASAEDVENAFFKRLKEFPIAPGKQLKADRNALIQAYEILKNPQSRIAYNFTPADQRTSESLSRLQKPAPEPKSKPLPAGAVKVLPIEVASDGNIEATHHYGNLGYRDERAIAALMKRMSNEGVKPPKPGPAYPSGYTRGGDGYFRGAASDNDAPLDVFFSYLMPDEEEGQLKVESILAPTPSLRGAARARIRDMVNRGEARSAAIDISRLLSNDAVAEWQNDGFKLIESEEGKPVLYYDRTHREFRGDPKGATVYEKLGVSREASAEEIRLAAFALKQRYRSDQEKIGKLVEGANLLLQTDKREGYDKEIESRPLSNPRSDNLFSRLGVSTDVTNEQLTDAYLSARELHPGKKEQQKLLEAWSVLKNTSLRNQLLSLETIPGQKKQADLIKEGLDLLALEKLGAQLRARTPATEVIAFLDETKEGARQLALSPSMAMRYLEALRDFSAKVKSGPQEEKKAIDKRIADLRKWHGTSGSDQLQEFVIGLNQLSPHQSDAPGTPGCDYPNLRKKRKPPGRG